MPEIPRRWVKRWGGADATYDGVTFDDAFDTMLAMQAEGRIDHIGLSNVSIDQVRRAHARSPIASVSNYFGYTNQADAPTLEYCTENGIPYLPYGPLGYGPADGLPPSRHGFTPSQTQLAWLLTCSPVTVVIAGTSSVKHLEENIAAGVASDA